MDQLANTGKAFARDLALLLVSSGVVDNVHQNYHLRRYGHLIEEQSLRDSLLDNIITPGAEESSSPSAPTSSWQPEVTKTSYDDFIPTPTSSPLECEIPYNGGGFQTIGAVSPRQNSSRPDISFSIYMVTAAILFVFCVIASIVQEKRRHRDEMDQLREEAAWELQGTHNECNGMLLWANRKVKEVRSKSTLTRINLYSANKKLKHGEAKLKEATKCNDNLTLELYKTRNEYGGKLRTAHKKTRKVKTGRIQTAIVLSRANKKLEKERKEVKETTTRNEYLTKKLGETRSETIEFARGVSSLLKKLQRVAEQTEKEAAEKKTKLGEELQEVKSDLAKANDEQTGLQNKLKDAESKLKTRTDENDSLAEKLEEFKFELNAMGDDNTDLQNKLDDAESKLQTKNDEMADLTEELEKTKSELHSIGIENTDLQNNLEDAESELRTRNDENNSLAKELKETMSELNSMGGENADLAEKLDEARAIIEDLTEENLNLKNVEEEKFELESKLDEAKSKKERVRIEIDELKRSIQALEDNLSSIRNASESQVQNIVQLEQKVRDAEAETQTAMDTTSMSQEELKTVKKENAELQTRLEETETASEEAAADAQLMVEELHEQLQGAQEAAKNVSSTRVELRVDLFKVNREKEQALARANDLEAKCYEYECEWALNAAKANGDFQQEINDFREGLERNAEAFQEPNKEPKEQLNEVEGKDGLERNAETLQEQIEGPEEWLNDVEGRHSEEQLPDHWASEQELFEPDQQQPKCSLPHASNYATQDDPFLDESDESDMTWQAWETMSKEIAWQMTLSNDQDSLNSEVENGALREDDKAPVHWNISRPGSELDSQFKLDGRVRVAIPGVGWRAVIKSDFPSLSRGLDRKRLIDSQKQREFEQRLERIMDAERTGWR